MVITIEDAIRAGACRQGALKACEKVGIYAFDLKTALDVFSGDAERILFAAEMNGDGDGYGYGTSTGDGYGDGDGE